MKKADKNDIKNTAEWKRFIFLECIILAIGIALSVSGTIKIIRYSTSYLPYFGIGVLGVAFIAFLIIFRKKKFSVFVGIGLIVFYMFFAGFAYLVCQTNSVRLRHLEEYNGKEVYLYAGGEWYKWYGETEYNTADLQGMNLYGQDAAIIVGDEEKEVSYVLYNPKDPNTLYYEFYSSGDCLVMKKQIQ